jgi:hypothetical protein
MKLSQPGEARVAGYLFILGRSLRSFLPREVASDALREVESHLRERLDEADAQPNEAAAVERVLQQLGAPLHVARAYAAELTVEEAVATGRVAPTLRALLLLATTTVGGFFAALGVFVLGALAVAFLVIAVMSVTDPQHTGLIIVDGVPLALGRWSELPPGARVVNAPWLIALCVVLSAATAWATRATARRLLRWWHRRISSVRLRSAP